MSPIRAVEVPTAAIEPVGGPRETDAATGAASESFASTLAGAIQEARASERTASEASAGFAAGDPAVGIHEVVIAAEKANVSLRYATTLKNKLLDAYRELMNTQV
jgi:flagellar hook-basal body complex protein FliE